MFSWKNWLLTNLFVMSKDSGYNDLRLKIELNELERLKSIILNLRSGMTMLSFCSDSIVLEYWWVTSLLRIG